MHWRRKWQPTPVFLPGESQGQGLPSMGLHRVGHHWNDAAVASPAINRNQLNLYPYAHIHTSHDNQKRLSMLPNVFLVAGAGVILLRTTVVDRVWVFCFVVLCPSTCLSWQMSHILENNVFCNGWVFWIKQWGGAGTSTLVHSITNLVVV